MNDNKIDKRRLRWRYPKEIPVGAFLYPHDTVCEVLRIDEGEDRFGTPLVRFWCKRSDTGQEGYVSYGIEGTVPTLPTKVAKP